MTGLCFIAAAAGIVVALAGVAIALARAAGLNRRWKAAEPEVIAAVEGSLGEKVLQTFLLNANDSADFSRGRGFWLWLACTAGHVAFADRNRLAGTGEGTIRFSKRADAAMQRIDKHFAQLDLRDLASAQTVRFVVLLRPRDGAKIGRFIRIRRNVN